MISLKTNKAFTLIELLVGIIVIALIFLGTTSIDFSRLNQKQKLDIFTNNIRSDFERIRNNALLGKGIGVDLNIPEKWRIEYSIDNSLSSSGAISSSYTDNNNDWIENNTTTFKPKFSIEKIECFKINGTSEGILSNSEKGIFEFDGVNIILIGDCTASSRILEVTIKYLTKSKILVFNSLNGLVKEK